MKPDSFFVVFGFFSIQTIKLSYGLNANNYYSICNFTDINVRYGDIEQCSLCTNVNSSSCFARGVFDRFFVCGNRLDDSDFSCNMDKNETIIFNHGSIFPP